VVDALPNSTQTDSAECARVPGFPGFSYPPLLLSHKKKKKKKGQEILKTAKPIRSGAFTATSLAHDISSICTIS
jgi:hypothetical protein